AEAGAARRALHRNHHRVQRRVHLFRNAPFRTRQIAEEGAEAFPQAAPVEDETAENVDEASGAGETTAETDRAETPAAAIPEGHMPDMLLEGLSPQECLRDLRRQQALEDGCRLFFTLEAIQPAVLQLVRQTPRELHRRELIRQVGAV